jgi:hypothetical protein
MVGAIGCIVKGMTERKVRKEGRLKGSGSTIVY